MRGEDAGSQLRGSANIFKLRRPHPLRLASLGTSPIEGEEVGQPGSLPPLDGEGPAEGRGVG
jgi:hypothetical protein